MAVGMAGFNTQCNRAEVVARLIKKPGFAFCIVCDKEIKYGMRGRVALVDHVGNDSHKKILKMRKSNTVLPGQ